MRIIRFPNSCFFHDIFFFSKKMWRKGIGLPNWDLGALDRIDLPSSPLTALPSPAICLWIYSCSCQILLTNILINRQRSNSSRYLARGILETFRSWPGKATGVYAQAVEVEPQLWSWNGQRTLVSQASANIPEIRSPNPVFIFQTSSTFS